MKVSRLWPVFLMVSTGLWFLNGCSVGVDPQTGTETGNPAELAACARLAFDAISPGDGWHVETYVPGGFDRLDSSAIVSGPASSGSSQMLAKRRMGKGDTLIDGILYITDTLYIDDTIPIYDTIFRDDTTFIRDTLIEEYVVQDTIDTTSGNETTLIVAGKSVIDSVFVVDTIARIDTIVYFDTIFIRDTILIYDTIMVSDSVQRNETSDYDGAYAPSAISNAGAQAEVLSEVVYSGPVYNPTDSVVYIGAKSADASWITPVRYDLKKLESFVSITKYYTTAAGVKGQETYIDIDGDGVLFSSTDAASPRLRYVNSATSPAELFYARVDFDAGSDHDFNTVADNRILYLFAERRLSSGFTVASYEGDSVSSPSDTVRLVYDKYFARDSMESLATTYKMIRKIDPTSHHSDRLVAIHRSVIYRYGYIKTIEMEIRLPSPVAKGDSPERGSITATIELSDGMEGILSEGEIYADLGFLQGVYMKGCYKTDDTCKKTDIEFDVPAW